MDLKQTIDHLTNFSGTSAGPGLGFDWRLRLEEGGILVNIPTWAWLGAGVLVVYLLKSGRLKI